MLLKELVHSSSFSTSSKLKRLSHNYSIGTSESDTFATCIQNTMHKLIQVVAVLINFYFPIFLTFLITTRAYCGAVRLYEFLIELWTLIYSFCD